MPTACGSRASRPTPPAGRSPNSSFATGCGPTRNDRIRAARATGLRNLPVHDTTQNKVWLEIVQIALDLLAWMPMLALTGKGRLWEPCRLRLRLFTAAAHSSPRAVGGPPTGPPLALDRRDHRSTGPARPPPQPRLTSSFPVPPSTSITARAVEPGAHPTRYSGPRPACDPSQKAKRSADSVGGPSRKIEAKKLGSMRDPLGFVIP
jgi:hypothetical protein